MREEGARMNRRGDSALGIVVLLCSLSAFGQHGGHGGGGGRGGAPRGTGSTSDSSLQDFNHALAVQATPDQVSRFQSLAKSFTKSQKSGLKELTKKLDKADSEVTKQKKALDQRLGLPQGNDEGVASMADKLEKALTDFQEQQLSLGKE